MRESYVIKIAVQGFWDFAGDAYARGHRFESVERAIERWLVDGPAAADCRLNYCVFLSAVACIFADIHDQCCVRKEPFGVFSSDVLIRHVESDVEESGISAQAAIENIFDPYVFTAEVEEHRSRR